MKFTARVRLLLLLIRIRVYNVYVIFVFFSDFLLFLYDISLHNSRGVYLLIYL